jgi:hypothetical protein
VEIDETHEYFTSRPNLIEKNKNHWVVETPWSLATEENKVQMAASQQD